MAIVCHAVSEVVVILQYNKNAENDRKIVNGIAI
jgi:hypothetical protein